jgi:2'-5' RNA ligase
MRLFLAIKLSAANRKKLAGLSKKMDPHFEKLNWVRQENLHLTLKFLGECSDEIAEQVVAALSDVPLDIRAFELDIASVGAFPSPYNARNIWAGLAGELDMLQRLFDYLTASLAPLGLGGDREKLYPHITLARSRKPIAKTKMIPQLSLYKEERFGTERVKEFCLIRSDLLPEGAQYVELNRFEL